MQPLNRAFREVIVRQADRGFRQVFRIGQPPDRDAGQADAVQRIVFTVQHPVQENLLIRNMLRGRLPQAEHQAGLFRNRFQELLVGDMFQRSLADIIRRQLMIIGIGQVFQNLLIGDLLRGGGAHPVEFVGILYDPQEQLLIRQERRGSPAHLKIRVAERQIREDGRILYVVYQEAPGRREGILIRREHSEKFFRDHRIGDPVRGLPAHFRLIRFPQEPRKQLLIRHIPHGTDTDPGIGMGHGSPEAEKIVPKRFSCGEADFPGGIPECDAEKQFLIRQLPDGFRTDILIRILRRGPAEQVLIRKPPDRDAADIVFRVRHHDVKVPCLVHDPFFHRVSGTVIVIGSGKPSGSRRNWRIHGATTLPAVPETGAALIMKKYSPGKKDLPAAEDG